MGDSGMDSLFETFLNDVNTLKSSKMKKLEKKLSKPEDIVERLVKEKPTNPFAILQISPDMPDEQIAKHYRKMSILIHPDKCRDEAKKEAYSDAFQILAKAFNDLKDPAAKEKYTEVIEEAKTRVTRRRTLESARLNKAGEDALELEGREFDDEVMKMCDKMLTEDVEKVEYSAKTLKANEDRIRGGAGNRLDAKAEENMKKRKWEKTRDSRVLGWRSFLHNVDKKDFKTKTHGKVGVVGAGNMGSAYQREKNANEDKRCASREDDRANHTRAAGMQWEYKKTWR